MTNIHMGDNKSDGFGSIPWVLLGVAGGLGLYWLLKPKAKSIPGVTQAAPVAPLTAPSRFADLDSVDARFGQVRELYKMGYMSPTATLGELTTLEAAAQNLASQDGEKAGSILARIDAYKAEINTSAALALKGARYRIMN